MTDIRPEKHRLRALYRSKRKSLDINRRRELDLLICENIAATAEYSLAQSVLFYYPINEEIDLTPQMTRALEDGKRIAFPKCTDASRMNFHFVASPDLLIPGMYGIPEPGGDEPVADPRSKRALCLLPALCFDRRGYRIGYGNGYYDRYLSGFSGRCIGVIYEDFITDVLPRGRFDRAVDLIATEKGVKKAFAD